MCDEFDDLLRPPELLPGSLEAVEKWTVLGHRQLRRRRRWRQTFQTIFSLGLVAMGMALGTLLFPPPQQEARALPVTSSTETTPPLLTAAQLELEAEKADTAGESAQFYRQAGDRYLDAQDIPSALRCYRLHLTEGGQPVRSPLTSDSWLLISLKTNQGER